MVVSNAKKDYRVDYYENWHKYDPGMMCVCASHLYGGDNEDEKSVLPGYQGFASPSALASQRLGKRAVPPKTPMIRKKNSGFDCGGSVASNASSRRTRSAIRDHDSASVFHDMYHSTAVSLSGGSKAGRSVSSKGKKQEILTRIPQNIQVKKPKKSSKSKTTDAGSVSSRKSKGAAAFQKSKSSTAMSTSSRRKTGGGSRHGRPPNHSSRRKTKTSRPLLDRDEEEEEVLRTIVTKPSGASSYISSMQRAAANQKETIVPANLMTPPTTITTRNKQESASAALQAQISREQASVQTKLTQQRKKACINELNTWAQAALQQQAAWLDAQKLAQTEKAAAAAAAAASQE
mmetsp:Transcript_6705/g.14019  ORF Transcript_6705/g.14019 Transcript_6705/m.14019 type:complete len:347 (-) Transcript_6705:201-1241(-)